MFGFSYGNALPSQGCPVELFGVITRSGKEYPSLGSQRGNEYCCVPNNGSGQESDGDRFYTLAVRTIQRLMTHSEVSRCSCVSVWSYVVATGRPEVIVSSTATDPNRVIPQGDLLNIDSIPEWLVPHLDHYYRKGVTPPPIQYSDEVSRFVLILPATQRDGQAGFTCLFHNDLATYNEDDVDLLLLLSESLIYRFHAWQHRDNLQVKVRRSEQQRIARDLHDTIVQDATGAVLELENARLSLTETSTGTDEVRQHVMLASGLTRSVVERLRKLVWSLHSNHY